MRSVCVYPDWLADANIFALTVIAYLGFEGTGLALPVLAGDPSCVSQQMHLLLYILFTRFW